MLRSTQERGIAVASSPFIGNVEVSWSHGLEYFENNLTTD